jgi:kynureninase
MNAYSIEETMMLSSSSFFYSSLSGSSSLGELLVSNPDKFITELYRQDEPLSLTMAQKLDQLDPLKETAAQFDIGSLIPFAGHSLGPLFKPVQDEINKTLELQKKLHAGHFSQSHPDGNRSAHWFDCDRETTSLMAAQQLLGFKELNEFNFTTNGLSDNLATLMDNFYKPGKKDWQNGRTKIAILAKEFFSDQAIVRSVVNRAISTAKDFEVFDQAEPSIEDQILQITPDEKGLYSTENIISTVRANASHIQILWLSDVVFSTGQRLELNKIFSALKDVIEKNNIIVGLELAHTFGNRPIDLKNFPVRIWFAVCCAYKHICGSAGSGAGFYVNCDDNLKKYPPLQGWKAADSSRVFEVIDSYDSTIMADKGALAFRISNPSPIGLLAVQTYLRYFCKIGFNKCVNKSESLTRYMIAQLKKQLGDKIEFITPEDPDQRGAMIVFRVKNGANVADIEHQLKEVAPEFGRFEIDTRPPNNIRLTAHYGYTKFEHIARLVHKLGLVLAKTLKNENVQLGESKEEIRIMRK